MVGFVHVAHATGAEDFLQLVVADAFERRAAGNGRRQLPRRRLAQLRGNDGPLAIFVLGLIPHWPRAVVVVEQLMHLNIADALEAAAAMHVKLYALEAHVLED